MFSMLTTSVIILFLLIRSLTKRIEELEKQLAPDDETKKAFNEAMDHLEAAMHVLVEHISGVKPS